ncbi:unnamed protein product [Lymnaea stagnalis]|uniref:Ig-like domain-containing protein n=1 Tax=Lymnaea stagnalis TaxID=6523 RepID=A0AAV2HCI5_LYMST
MKTIVFSCVTFLFIVQSCTANLPICGDGNETTVCNSNEYSGACNVSKCACAAGFQLTGQETCKLSAPVITGVADINNLFQKKDYNLLCSTHVIKPNVLTFSWRINGTVTNVKDQNYPIKEAKESDDGEYSCTASVGGQNATSEKVTLTFKNAVSGLTVSVLVLAMVFLTNLINAV